ncbi:MAG TPA: aryl-sulfate sulfotransferase [Polyangiaceae bacterium]|nr:aryl-sulfate sulfotransferase [Polyangiaceae bacterium]
MIYSRTRLIVGSSLLAALVGCGNSAHNTSNSSGGSSSGAAGGSGGTGGTSGTASGGTSTGAAGTGTLAKSGGAGGTSGASGMPSSGGTGVTAGSGGTSAPAGGAGVPGSSAGAGGVSGSGPAASGGSAGATVTGSLTLTIDPNPNSVISCFVSWHTDQPANSVVQFGDTAYEWEISDDTMVTDHKVLVIGMHAMTSYMIKAISGSASGTGTFMTGMMPATIPNGTVMIHDTTKTQPGWTLMNVQKGNGTTNARSDYPPMAVIYDENGLPVWYVIDGTNPDIGGAVSTQLTDKGVLIGPTWNANLTNGTPPREYDFAGNIIWECTYQACLPGGNVTHHAAKLPNGHYVIIEYVNASGGLQNPVFHELDADSNEVWHLDYASLVPPPSGSTSDWCHANSITLDIDKNEVWANCRWVGLLKTTYTNPTKQWLLQAKYGSKGLGDFAYSPTTSEFDDSHDPEIHEDDGTILFFDNGGYSQGAVGGDTSMFHSRAVEYTVDETAKTATLEWEFPGSFAVPDSWYTDKWYTPFWGDADRQPNGNILITGGIRNPSVESRVFEVTKADGKVVWEFRFPPDYGVYRSDRITPPLVHAITN